MDGLGTTQAALWPTIGNADCAKDRARLEEDYTEPVAVTPRRHWISNVSHSNQGKSNLHVGLRLAGCEI